MQVLHAYNDRSRLGLMNSSQLLCVPIWKGNRIIDSAHVKKIAESVGDDVKTLDSGYRLVSYSEEDSEGRQVKQTYVIDGQHRLAVVRAFYEERLCESPFEVTVTEFEVASEEEAIEYFNRINNVKPIQFKEDPRLVVNKYISAIAKRFAGGKLLRSVTTHRPYLSVDRLRDVLITWIDSLVGEKPVDFAARVVEKNHILLGEFELLVALGCVDKKDKSMIDKCLALKFALAMDPKMGWVRELLC